MFFCKVFNTLKIYTNLSGCLHGSLTLPAISMCSGVWVTVVVNLVGQHGIQHSWVLIIYTKENTHIKL